MAVAGCTKEDVGTVIGAGGGAVAGKAIGGHGTSGVVGTALGTLAGAWIGREIGRTWTRPTG